MFVVAWETARSPCWSRSALPRWGGRAVPTGGRRSQRRTVSRGAEHSPAPRSGESQFRSRPCVRVGNPHPNRSGNAESLALVLHSVSVKFSIVVHTHGLFRKWLRSFLQLPECLLAAYYYAIRQQCISSPHHGAAHENPRSAFQSSRQDHPSPSPRTPTSLFWSTYPTPNPPSAPQAQRRRIQPSMLHAIIIASKHRRTQLSAKPRHSRQLPHPSLPWYLNSAAIIS